MTEKENALRILRFDNPRWVMSGLPTYSLCYTGCHHEGYAGGGHDCPVGSRWTDIWGTVWHKEHEGVMGFPRGNPLADIGALRTYTWPDPDDERICGKIYRLRREFGGGDFFLEGSHRDTLWEKSYMLVGMENMMEYIFTEPGYVREILHRIMDFQLAVARQYLSLGVEMVSLGDDLGTQAGPLLGPRIVEEFLVPEYRRLTDLYRGGGVIINFHSCGNVESAIDVFLRLGIDVLNPVQATANDLDMLRAATAGKMALQGGVSTATIMAGPVEKIVQEVRRRLWQLGRDGGYFCAPDQGMPFPKEHIEAVHETIRRYGRYPMSDPVKK